jgi:hypothetical protein
MVGAVSRTGSTQTKSSSVKKWAASPARGTGCLL